jgi:hypothetical protein
MSRYLAIFRDAQHNTSPVAVSAVSADSPTVPPVEAANDTNDTNGNGWRASKADPEAADDGWLERAAIAEHDGRLTRADAEMVADADHPPAAGDAPPADWQRWYATALSERSGRMSEADASRRTWGEALNLWHHHHGARPDGHQCAGCGAPLGGRAMVLPDGARVHDDARMLDCLSTHGQRWRPVAAAALEGLGIEPPETLG